VTTVSHSENPKATFDAKSTAKKRNRPAPTKCA